MKHLDLRLREIQKLVWEEICQVLKVSFIHRMLILTLLHQIQIDGTENPTELDEKVEATLTPNGDSFLLAQKWIHNLKFFHSLSLKEQEADIGRTKQDSIELEDKPPTSHVARVVIEEDGKEIDVIRQSMPFGSLREHGLFFISYANSTKIFTHQLESMVGKGKHATPEGHNDHLMRFSRNVLGSFYYVPSLSSLKRVVDGLMLHHHRLSKLWAVYGHRSTNNVQNGLWLDRPYFH